MQAPSRPLRVALTYSTVRLEWGGQTIPTPRDLKDLASEVKPRGRCKYCLLSRVLPP